MQPPLVPLLSAFAEVGVRAARAPIRLTAGIIAAAERPARGIRGLAADSIVAVSARAIDGVLGLLLDVEVTDRVLARARQSGAAARVAERLLEDGTVEQIAARITQGPELGRMLATALQSDQVQRALTDSLESEAAVRLLERLARSPGSDRLVAAVLASPLPEQLVSRLLESEQLWVLVDEITQSPAVTAAITQQGRGFVEEVADRARERSRTADAWLVDLVRRRRRMTPSAASKPAARPESGPS